MVEIIHKNGVARLRPSIGQFVIHKGTVVFPGQPFCLSFQTAEIAPVPSVVNGMIQRKQMGIFFCDIVQNVLLETAPQVQIFQPYQIALILYPLKDRLKIRDAGKRGEMKQTVRIPAS